MKFCTRGVGFPEKLKGKKTIGIKVRVSDWLDPKSCLACIDFIDSF